MTTLAIIGSGILGRSLIYTLAKEQKAFEKITVFYSDTFTFPCTLHSTAVASRRGVTTGHSALGDLLVESFKVFSEHVSLDQPEGVEKITQFSAATTKLDSFKARYPHGSMAKAMLKNEVYIAEEVGYLVDPRTYTDWLLKEAMAMEQYHLEMVNDLVIDVHENERVHIKTQNGRNFSFDKVVFAGGTYNRFWKDLVPESKLKTTKTSQGSYVEFNQVSMERPSFSLTLDGDNLVWNNRLKRLLVGSTTLETNHTLAPMDKLVQVYHRLQNAVDLPFPAIADGVVKVGLREKAQKREPYIIADGKKFFIGGLYKNGFVLPLKMTRSLSHQYL